MQDLTARSNERNLAMCNELKRWEKDYNWIWDQEKNPNMTKRATLVATVSADPRYSRQIEDRLSACSMRFDFDHWGIGGAEISVVYLNERTIELRISSTGEDSLESLFHASEVIYSEVINTDSVIGVTWAQLPLQNT